MTIISLIIGMILCLTGRDNGLYWLMIAGIWYIGYRIPRYIVPGKDDIIEDSTNKNN